MSFVSLQFLIFFPIVVGLYFFLPHRFRWALLLAASYFFYMSWKPAYAVLLFLSTVVSYAAALAMARTQNARRKKMYLWFSVLISLGVLFFYKYLNFFNDTVASLASFVHLNWEQPHITLLLPVGISFYIFKSLSYTIDVYRGRKEPETHFGIYALYVSFFPQLIAGPIDRSTALLPQFRERFSFAYERVVAGLQLMVWGFFKKIVVADGLALFVDRAYADVNALSGPAIILVSVLFALQLYADFSGYSDIAIGSARVMGFRLMKNFDHPYSAQSVQEFWQRWHISLTTWFRDYVYTPLAFSWRRLGRKGLMLAIVLTFLLTGIWHGAGMTFVMFGLLHGCAVLFDVLTKKQKEFLARRMPRVLFGAMNRAWVFIFWSFSLIFFRAQNMRDAWRLVTHLAAAPASGIVSGFRSVWVNMEYEFFVVLAALLIMACTRVMEKREDAIDALRKKPAPLRWFASVLVVLCILLFGTYGATEFIYVQF